MNKEELIELIKTLKVETEEFWVLSDALVTILENWGNLNSETLISTFNQISVPHPSP